MNRRGFLRALGAAAVAIPLAPLLPKTPAPSTAWRANIYPLWDMGIVSQQTFLESYGLYFNDGFINGFDAAEERFITRMRWPVGLATFNDRSVLRLTRTIDL